MRGLFLVGLLACGDEVTADEATLCEGAGDPALQVGTGGIDGFDAWGDGSVVETSLSGEVTGIRIELLTTGLDTTDLVSVVVRTDVGGASDDALSSVSLQCPAEGPGWLALFAPLPDVGDEVTLTATATDAAGDSASVGPMQLTLTGG